MVDAAALLCRCAAEHDPRIWPEDAVHVGLNILNHWAALRVVREVEPLGKIHCPVCRPRYDKQLTQLLQQRDPGGVYQPYAEDPDRDWCWATVVLDRADGVIVSAVAHCPRNGETREITPNLVRLWEVDLPVLAKVTATLLGTRGRVRELDPGRLFHLGTEPGPPHRDVFLIRGPAWEGADRIMNTAGHAAGGFDRVVGVVLGTVAPDLATARSSEMLLLNDLLQWTGAGFVRREGGTPSPSLTVTPAIAAPQPRGRVRPIPTPEGTVWEAIHVRVGEKHLCARIQGERHWRHFAEAGFADGRRDEGSGEVTKLWRLLVEVASAASPSPSTEGTSGGRGRPAGKPPAMSREPMSRLRPRLRRLFPSVPSTKCDPILSVPKGPQRIANNGRAYRFRFQITSLPDPCFRTPVGVTWSDLIVRLQRSAWEEMIEVTVRHPHDEGRQDAASGRTPETQGAGEVFRLKAVVTSVASEDLLAKLLGEGVLMEPRDSAPVYGLRRDLARFFDLEPDGIKFDAGQGAWLPVFKVE